MITSFIEKEKNVIYIIISMAVETITATLWPEKVTDSVLPVVVNFSAVRCGFCQALEPLYNRLSGQYNNKLIFLKLMVDDQNNQELLDRISIGGTPMLKFYCKNREIGEHIGYAIEPVLKQKIETFLSEMEFCIKNSTK
ncbi:MAG TPA: thioredoxin family protein [Nitrososphaeraceae archaeon]|nr:thioredoxin family protein [Nitrososphaeraceae archaeon]